jgi:hypothetical protein
LAACFNLIKIANVSLWFPQFNLKAGVKRFRATLNQESWILAAHRIQPQLLWRRHLTDNCQRVYVYEPRALLETFGFWHESSVFWHWSLWVSNRRLQALGFRLRFKCFGLSFKLMVLGCRVQTWGEFQRPLHPPRTTYKQSPLPPRTNRKTPTCPLGPLIRPSPRPLGLFIRTSPLGLFIRTSPLVWPTRTHQPVSSLPVFSLKLKLAVVWGTSFLTSF